MPNPPNQNGYAKIWRCMIDHPVWQQGPQAVTLWIWLILNAQWKDGDRLKQGQWHTTWAQMREALKTPKGRGHHTPSENVVKRILSGWKADGMVTLLADPRGITVTICNYDRWNNVETSADPNSVPIADGKRTPQQEVQEIKEVQKTTKFVDLMADAWSSISAPDQTPPYSMFNKWRAAHGEALCLAGIRKVSMNGKTFDGSPLAYVASVITAMAGEAQQSLEAAASDPQLIFPDNMVGQHIVYPNTNNPIKDRTKRMAAILGRDPSASADPDPDHPWTIPDSEFNA